MIVSVAIIVGKCEHEEKYGLYHGEYVRLFLAVDFFKIPLERI